MLDRSKYTVESVVQFIEGGTGTPESFVSDPEINPYSELTIINTGGDVCRISTFGGGGTAGFDIRVGGSVRFKSEDFVPRKDNFTVTFAKAATPQTVAFVMSVFRKNNC